MKNIIAAFFLAVGCAKAPPAPNTIHPRPVTENQSINLIGRFSMAHACAVNDRVLTAAHVAFPMQEGQELPQWYTWSDGVREGWMSPGAHSEARDVAVLIPEIGDTPKYHKVASSVIVGEKITWYEYQYSSGSLFQVEHREGKVERLIAGHIVMDGKVIEGTSGGCLFNDKMEVVGIVVWSFSAGSGVAVDLTGSWWPFN